MGKIHENNALGELASAIGKGLLAGLAGTAAITVSQMIEMKITERQPSEAPIKVASQVTGAAPADDSQKEKLSNEIHYAYGTSWGVVRGLLGMAGLKGIPATLVHFGAIWAAELIMLPKYDAAPPVTEQKPKDVAIDALHHAVYAIASGLAYDALDAGSSRERKLRKVMKKLRLDRVLK